MKLAQRIREEFEETAGLRLTGAEAAGYFALELGTCIQVFATLYESGFLTKDLDGRYVVGFPPRDELWQRSNGAGSQRRLKSRGVKMAKPPSSTGSTYDCVGRAASGMNLRELLAGAR